MRSNWRQGRGWWVNRELIIDTLVDSISTPGCR
ncbi:MAG: hypothetical protein ACI8V5_003875, partial [Limisphaerales bacterium]